MTLRIDQSRRPAPAQGTAALDERSLHLRRLVFKALLGGGRGHVGPAMSLIEILRILYDDILRIAPEQANDPERDRLILSKGHGCLALYALLADRGFFPVSELETFCRPGSRLGGHPERNAVPGVEASTGALGHGLSIGVGIALAARMQKRRSRVYVVMGDGELNEGSVWEACMAAAKHRLENLVAIVDYNKLQSYGPVSEVQELSPLPEKFASFGFTVHEVDGHDVAALQRAFAALPAQQNGPVCIICHTVKGKGVPPAEHNADWHHKAKLSPEELASVRAALEMTDA
jgi:transketolase